ncbi:unnamed protein product [Periconia digitata]|uniref:Uncharacterized protein n=1 Tax=Periconia digitata TaxID=1303443 RepID=A0A9W4XT56_9PLEO|nr:unnamed protein product [Periconia digitata]
MERWEFADPQYYKTVSSPTTFYPSLELHFHKARPHPKLLCSLPKLPHYSLSSSLATPQTKIPIMNFLYRYMLDKATRKPFNMPTEDAMGDQELVEMPLLDESPGFSYNTTTYQATNTTYDSSSDDSDAVIHTRAEVHDIVWARRMYDIPISSLTHPFASVELLS